ncbi:hypothetical protein ACHAW6_009672 [Cyclotella cf. meneghiniana]
MTIWQSMWMCPGWVFCPQKPHPFGNKYHTICCAKSGILFDFEIVEGTDHPIGSYVVLDSGFCVLQALVELKKFGVYAGALIKKWRYWASLVPGKAIDEYFNNKVVGDVDSVEGNLDGVRYNIWCMKTQGTLQKLWAQHLDYSTLTIGIAFVCWVTLKYTEPFYLRNKYCHLVDDHNNKRHTVPSIEGSLKTQRWTMRVFQYVLATTETDCFLAHQYFSGSEMQILDFRHELAWDLILNPHCHVAPVQSVGTRCSSNRLVRHET